MIGHLRSLKLEDWFFAIFTGLWAAGTARLLYILPAGVPRGNLVEIEYGCLGFIAGLIGALVARRARSAHAERLAIAFVVTAPVFGLLVAATFFVMSALNGHIAPVFETILALLYVWVVASGIAFFSGAMGIAVLWLLTTARGLILPR
jgi:ABC-type transport system involved in cytochrome c biogenesis permease subunit